MITHYPYRYYPPHLPLRIPQLSRRCIILAHLGHSTVLVQFLDGTRAWIHTRDLAKEVTK